MKLKIETITNRKKTIINIACDEFTISEGINVIATSKTVEEQTRNNEKFEAFWNDYGKIGNKLKAGEMYRRAVMVVKPEYLNEQLQAYLKFLRTTDQFQMHASTWLNPRYREFDNELSLQKTEKREIDYNEKL